MTDSDKMQETKKQIEKEIKENKTILFMKGTREMPQCGFSARVVQILNAANVDYTTRNVLEDDNLRQGIKEYSNWPTIPQLYVNNEFVGGCDIVIELEESGELQKLLA